MTMLPVLTVLICIALIVPAFAASDSDKAGKSATEMKVDIPDEITEFVTDMFTNIFKDFLFGKEETANGEKAVEEDALSDASEQKLPPNMKDGVDVVAVFADGKA